MKYESITRNPVCFDIDLPTAHSRCSGKFLMTGVVSAFKIIVEVLVPIFVSLPFSLASAAESQSTTAEPLILLVHGRGQSPEKRNDIQNGWLRSVELGMKAADPNSKFDQKQFRFVWYADLFSGTPGCQFADARSADSFKAPGAKQLPKVQDLLATIAGKLNSEQQRAAVQTLMADVANYLDNGEIACAVDRRLSDAIESDKSSVAPIIIVAHSLGSLVVYKNLMSRLAGLKRDVHFISIGSMLGAPVVQRALLGSLAASPAKVPMPVLSWVNVMHVEDSLAFKAAPAFTSKFPKKIPADVEVKYPATDPHSANYYLQSKEVGSAVLRAICLSAGRKTECAQPK